MNFNPIMNKNLFFLLFLVLFHRMIRSFLRRHHLFLLNLTSASGLLATSDLFVQIFYEKKKSVDDKRFRMYMYKSCFELKIKFL
jgi:hypothetical protein